jgi:dTDP-4-amino-4,6-dideoxygalactose transaminase
MDAAEASKYRPEHLVPFVALERQHAGIVPQLDAAFVRLIRSSAFILGHEVESFEHEFAAYSEVAHCIGVGSGTAALGLILEASGIGPGDEVIVPAHTFIASALAIAHVGATPVLCDVEHHTGLIDADAARAAIGPRTAAIIAVHLYGQTCNMASIEAIAKPHGLLVLEDAAQAHGARYCGHRAGSLGGAAAFSFYPTKNLGALGDGGAVCTDDDLLASKVRRLRDLGRTNEGEHVDAGYNERLDGLQAALLRVKLNYLEGWNEARRAHAAHYRRLLGDCVQLLAERPQSPCVYHLFPVRVSRRDAVAAALRARGIATKVHYTPAVHEHPAWRGHSIVYGELPTAEAWAAEELSLPMHPHLFPEEIERVAEELHSTASASAVSEPACHGELLTEFQLPPGRSAVGVGDPGESSLAAP